MACYLKQLVIHTIKVLKKILNLDRYAIVREL